MNDSDRLRRLAFSHIRGISLEKAEIILEKTGGLDAFFDMPGRLLQQTLGSTHADFTDAGRAALLEWAAQELEFALAKGIRTPFFTDSDFPRRLRECQDAPVLLYQSGPANLNSAHIISIVGTRRATAYGQRMTASLISDMATAVDDLVVVSGLAYGIDVAAHKAALQASVPTVAVVAHGLQTIYPADHRDIAVRMVRSGGAIVTEYPSKAPVHKGNFLARNRIVAGISDATLIVESDSRGGSMVTASIASDYNRDVMAVPGRATDRYSSGPNSLIFRNKAVMVRDADDIIDSLRWQRRPIAGEQQKFDFESLPPEKRQLIGFLRQNPEATVNDIVRELAIPYQVLASRMMELEFADLISALPGGRYQLNV